MRQLRQRFSTNGYFVADGNRGMLQTLDHFIGSGLHMLNPFVQESWLTQLSS
jgi:hypothetical protein